MPILQTFATQWAAHTDAPQPSFIIVGGMKCGSTSLHHLLRQQKGIFMPPGEVHYFDRCRGAPRGDKYARFFEGWNGETIVGEKTPAYALESGIMGRIAEALPHAKSVLVMRNPLARAYSNYWHAVKCGLEARSFEEAISAEAAGDARRFRDYLYRGRYDLHAANICDHFSHSAIIPTTLDELKSNPLETAAKLSQLLGGPGVGTATPRQSNPTVIPRSIPLAVASRRLLGARLGRAFTRRFNSNAAPGYPPMTSQARRILERYYDAAREQFRPLVGDLVDAWIDSPPRSHPSVHQGPRT